MESSSAAAKRDGTPCSAAGCDVFQNATGRLPRLSRLLYSTLSRAWRNWQTRRIEGPVPSFGSAGSTPVARTFNRNGRERVSIVNQIKEELMVGQQRPDVQVMCFGNDQRGGFDVIVNLLPINLGISQRLGNGCQT